jgi:hypothetical protein
MPLRLVLLLPFLVVPPLGRWEAGEVALLLVWGIAYGAVPVASQIWLLAVLALGAARVTEG